MVELLNRTSISAALPADAPNSYYEYSILPIATSTEAILLVADNDRLVLNDRWEEEHFCYRDYWQEALEWNGLRRKVDYDIYDIGVPGSSEFSWGPGDSLETYQTCIWFTGHLKEYCMLEQDQLSLINWLESPDSRDLLLCGDDIAEYLIDLEHNTMGFFQDYLCADYPTGGDPNPGSLIDPSIYDMTDSVVTLLNASAGDSFIRDGAAVLRGGCPRLRYYDKVDDFPGGGGARTTEYQSNKAGNPIFAAGCQAHVAPGPNTWDVVYLPYSFSTIRDWNDRAYMLRNILDFFGNAPPDTLVSIDTPVADKGYVDALYPNYPNPFNPGTVIRFSIKDDGPVVLKVFNITGQLVRTLFEGDMSAGVHELIWRGRSDDGVEVSSGVYFYSLEVAGRTFTSRVLLVK